MCFFGKKKKAVADPDMMEMRKILGNVLSNHRRTEKAPICHGIFADFGAPCAYIKTLGRALLEDLGKDGEVILYYHQKEKMLVLELTFSYVDGSDEMAIIQECLECFDTEEEETLPGDVTRTCTDFFTDATEIQFIAEDVERKDLEFAARSLVGHIFDWLDIVWENIQEEFGEDDE